MTRNAYQLLSAFPPLLTVYISSRGDQDVCMRLWHAVLLSLTQHPENLLSNLSFLVHDVQKGAFPAFLKPQLNELDTVVGGLLADVMEGLTNTEVVSIVTGILAAPGKCLNVTD